MREIVFDTETTGVNPIEHRLVEIGAVEIVGKMPTGRTFHKYINPEREVDFGALQVHGLTNDFLADKPLFSEVAGEFLDFIGDAPLVAHNAPFDMGFMNAQLQDIGFSELVNEVVDTLPMARRMFPGSRASLDALCQRFEVDSSSRTLHGALLDAELLAEVYLHLCGGPQQGLSFEEENKGEKKEGAVVSVNTLQGEFRQARRFDISPEELNAHEEFVKSIGSKLWF